MCDSLITDDTSGYGQTMNRIYRFFFVTFNFKFVRSVGTFLQVHHSDSLLTLFPVKEPKETKKKK